MKKILFFVFFISQLQIAKADYPAPFKLLPKCFESNTIASCDICFNNTIEISIGTSHNTLKKKNAIAEIQNFLNTNPCTDFKITNRKSYAGSEELLAVAELVTKNKTYKVLIHANKNEVIHSISIQ